MTLSNGQALAGAHIPALGPLRETVKLPPNASTLRAIRRASITGLSAVPSAGDHDVRVTAPSRSRRSCLRSRPPSSAETMSSQPSGEGRCRTERPGRSPRCRPCPPAPELKICVRSPARPTRCRMPTVGGIVHRYLPVSPRLAPWDYA